MKIVIDMQAVQNGSKDRGIGRYTQALVLSILKSDNEIILLFNGLFYDTIESLLQEYEQYIPRHNLIVFDALNSVDYLNSSHKINRKLSELIKEKTVADLNPDFFIVCSLFEGSKDDTLTTIKQYYPDIKTGVILYDLIPLISPEKYISYPPIKEWYFEKIEFLQKADILFSISESSKQEAIKYLKVPANKIVTISSAADTAVFNNSPSTVDNIQLLNRFKIDKPFLMHTSAYEGRKNFEGLIEAFALLPLHVRTQYQLVIVCKLTNFQKEHLVQAIEKQHLSREDVILTGYVSDEELVALYKECYLFVFPSMHEGFGLPALEAMSCGTATIGSNTTSIPEVIGLKEALFDPYSPLAIAQKIEEVLVNKIFWHCLKQHAKEQSLKFSWEKSASTLLDSLVPQPSSDRQYESYKVFKEVFTSFAKDYTISNNVLLRLAQIVASNEQKLDKYNFLSKHTPKSYIWRVEGPFDSSYSLSLLNRETARALAQLEQHVILHSTEGGGDFPANLEFLANNKDIALMHDRVVEFGHDEVDVLTRNLYPPRVQDMKSKINMLHHYAWEESGFPSLWADDFNTHLHLMTCLSTHVEKIMIDAGVKIPLCTSGCGVDHWERIVSDKNYTLKTKQFTFLHVSSCFPRKGVEALLEAYGQVFSLQDDVTLVIKTFANPHNKIREWLQHAITCHSNYPSVIIIEDDMKDEALKSLYEQCDVLVAPSYAEGFGLPLAEAMLSGIPVITTAWGGQMDFCNDDNAWLVDYQFEYAKTHFNLFDSVWAKIDISQLAKALNEAFNTLLEQRNEKAQKGRLLLLEKFKWKDTAQIMIDAITHPKQSQQSPLRIGWISSWKTKCGIATYSEHLIRYCKQTNIEIFSPFSQEIIANDESIRCWSAKKENNDFATLKKVIDEKQCDLLVIQFNYGFFNFQELATFIEEQHTKGRVIVMMMHSTHDPFGSTANWQLSELQEILSKCHRILVHSLADLNRLKNMGLSHNVTIFPHGILPFDTRTKQNAYDSSAPTIASYGFCLPHKGLQELVEAIHILHQEGLHVKLKMVNAEYPVVESALLIEELKKSINNYGLEAYIELNNAFLEDEESLKELSLAQLVVFPYQRTGESASGAVRYGLATGCPVAVTPLTIFEDLGESVFKLSGISPNAIAQSLKEILVLLSTNDLKAKHILKEADRWREVHDYRHLAKRLENICYAITQKAKKI